MRVKYCRAGAAEALVLCHSSQLSQVLLSALNQDLVQFTLKPGLRVNVYATRLSPGESASTATCPPDKHGQYLVETFGRWLWGQTSC